jgi:peptide/nickel transport system ATP-binding protein
MILQNKTLKYKEEKTNAHHNNIKIALARNENIGLLQITHDLAIVRYAADAVSVMYLGKLVEEGSAEAMWREPLHPYTEALIAAIPHADGLGAMPDALPGEVPDPAHPPSGCRFHPRCPYRFDRCSLEEPGLIALAGGRTAACWLHDDDRAAVSPRTKARRAAPEEVR